MAIKDEPRERLAEMASVLSEATKLLWEVSGSMERTGPPRLRIQLSTALMRAYEIRDWTISTATRSRRDSCPRRLATNRLVVHPLDG